MTWPKLTKCCVLLKCYCVPGPGPDEGAYSVGYGLVRMESHIFMVEKHPHMLTAVSGMRRGEHFSPWGSVLPGKLALQNGCAY